MKNLLLNIILLNPIYSKYQRPLSQIKILWVASPTLCMIYSSKTWRHDHAAVKKDFDDYFYNTHMTSS